MPPLITFFARGRRIGPASGNMIAAPTPSATPVNKLPPLRISSKRAIRSSPRDRHQHHVPTPPRRPFAIEFSPRRGANFTGRNTLGAISPGRPPSLPRGPFARRVPGRRPAVAHRYAFAEENPAPVPATIEADRYCQAVVSVRCAGHRERPRGDHRYRGGGGVVIRPPTAPTA